MLFFTKDIMTEKDLLDYIQQFVGERKVTFDELLNHLINDKGLRLTENELMGMLAIAGMLAPQVNDSLLMVRVKEGVEKMAPNQNPNQTNVLERMRQGPVKMPENQNPNKF